MSEEGLILEVGTGPLPIPAFLDRKIAEEKIKGPYIGVDIDSAKAEKAKVALSSYDREFEMITTDARRLPLPDHSVKEEIFRNVFCDPKIGRGILQEFIKEAARVLKPNGRVIIIGTNTPEAYQIEGLKELMAKGGFGLTNPASVGNKEEIAKYEGRIPLSENSYIAEFSPVKPRPDNVSVRRPILYIPPRKLNKDI